MEIKDALEKVHYHKSFPYEVSGGRFVETTEASAQLLRGRQGRWLLITYGTLPSTPLGGESWQVFGLFAGPPSTPLAGRLVPFSKPIFAEGQLINGKPGKKVVETSQEPKLQGDVLHFRVWAGNFFVIIPLRILWFQNTIGPAWRCVKMTARGPQPVCEVKVEAERHPAGPGHRRRGVSPVSVTAGLVPRYRALPQPLDNLIRPQQEGRRRTPRSEQAEHVIQGGKQEVGVGARERQRRAHLEHIVELADAAHEYAALLHEIDGAVTLFGGRFLGRAIAHQFDADPQAMPADVTDHRMPLLQAGEAGADIGADFARVVDQAFTVKHVKHGVADRA
jgi:hypothetical protein